MHFHFKWLYLKQQKIELSGAFKIVVEVDLKFLHPRTGCMKLMRLNISRGCLAGNVLWMRTALGH